MPLSSLQIALGFRGDTASPTGSANGKLAALVPLVSGLTGVRLVKPDLAVAVTVPNPATSNWAWGAYAEIVAASVLAAHSLVGIYARAGDNGSQADIQIAVAVGGAGAEVEIGRWALERSGVATASAIALDQLVFPGRQIPANARVAARIALSPNGSDVKCYLSFDPRPAA